MRKLILVYITLAFFSANSFACFVPDPVQKAFDKKFPAATHVRWGKENSREYEASFKINGTRASANFSDTGKWLETETEIPITQLPEVVAIAVNKQFVQFKITGVYKIENVKGETHYEAELKSKGRKKEVLINEDGTVIE